VKCAAPVIDRMPRKATDPGALPPELAIAKGQTKPRPRRKGRAERAPVAVAKARYQACMDCPHSRKKGFKCRFFSRCCFGAYRATAKAVCMDPDGAHWDEIGSTGEPEMKATDDGETV
jgi:hypothetical protein